MRNPLTALRSEWNWKDIQRAVGVRDLGILLQEEATRSLEWLDDHGRCLDHIEVGESTVDGAGHGAFATRRLAAETVITGTPLLHFPDQKAMQIYNRAIDDANANNDTMVVQGHQIILNYCFSHPETTLLLCPTGAGINYINHAPLTSTTMPTANVRVQWAADGQFRQDASWLSKAPTEMEHDPNMHLALDYIALRDIEKGEELFMDYGEAWEAAWARHVSHWAPHDTNYMSAADFNRQHSQNILRTVQEQRSNPSPSNLYTRCHRSLLSTTNKKARIQMMRTINFHDWGNYQGQVGYQCRIADRHEVAQEGQDRGGTIMSTYTVMLVMTEEADDGVYMDLDLDGTMIDQSENLTPPTHNMKVENVPREAIRFFDKPYSTDMHLQGAFRHALGLPNNIVPDAWRNVKPTGTTYQHQFCDGDGDDLSCQAP